ncbi:MAG: hypothetical protein LBT20_00785 [Clostridiales bacterium]|jgi:hypothetical protein|nr:hypothetical protein [Clostridiales bacterium]
MKQENYYKNYLQKGITIVVKVGRVLAILILIFGIIAAIALGNPIVFLVGIGGALSVLFPFYVLRLILSGFLAIVEKLENQQGNANETNKGRETDVGDYIK